MTWRALVHRTSPADYVTVIKRPRDTQGASLEGVGKLSYLGQSEGFARVTDSHTLVHYTRHNPARPAPSPCHHARPPLLTPDSESHPSLSPFPTLTLPHPSPYPQYIYPSPSATHNFLESPAPTPTTTSTSTTITTNMRATQTPAIHSLTLISTHATPRHVHYAPAPG
ncbi:hypothetical protein E2C01_017179 [Portunus trituberculatus]|uniref:Uncharacterized protein n=1 Tax=Portunus trituberculatus TaxID=210409 RepID=A0A5B7DRR7_PORTR|nr:hypothetical protein [Portunus trituberculatus]